MSRLFGTNGNGEGNGLAGPLDRIFRIAGVIGLVGLLLCVLGAIFDVQQVLRSYLMAYLFWLGLPIAATMLLLVNRLAFGTWGVISRRPLEAAAGTILLMAPLFLPIAFGINQVYPWAGAQHGEPHEESHGDEAVEASHEEPAEASGPVYAEAPDTPGEAAHHAPESRFNHKEIWFGRPFFFGRAAGYFAIWGLFAFLMVSWSSQQDRSADPEAITRRFGRVAAPGLILMFLSATFALFDWAMSLDPAWYSTIYGAMLIMGMGLQTLAFINIVTTLLTERGALEDLPQPKRLRDLGNLMLTFVMLWAYTSYSQFLIIWSGDLSEEIPWYLDRAEGGWQYVIGFLAVFHFFFPFFVLLFRSNKESTVRLRAISAVLFVLHAVDLFWLLGPSLGYERPIPHLLDFAAIVGLGGLWVAAFTFILKSRPFLAGNDPALFELRAHDHRHESRTGV